VIGIVTQKNEVYRIFPRSQDDIIIEGAVQEGEVLGVVSENDEWSLAQNNKKLKLTRYLLVVCVGLIIVLVRVIWTGRK